MSPPENFSVHGSENITIKTPISPSPKTGTGEWADYNVNCINGCKNACRYCYGATMALRFKRIDNRSDWENMEIRHEDVNKKYPLYDGRVMFPTSHDLFEDPEYKEACFTVLQNLFKSGNEVLITTKPRLNVIRNIDRKFAGYRDKFQFRFTIGSLNEDTLRYWEPGAPSYAERLECLKYAYKQGYKTSISAEPFLDRDPLPLVRELLPYVTDSFWLGIMTKIPLKGISEEDQPYYEAVRGNYTDENLRTIYENLKDDPKVRWKETIQKKLKLKSDMG